MTSISQTDSVFYFSINAPYKQCEVLYVPSMPDVVMVSESGLSVQVPTNRLRQFVTSDGIKGRFRMIIDANKKIKSFERLAQSFFVREELLFGIRAFTTPIHNTYALSFVNERSKILNATVSQYFCTFFLQVYKCPLYSQ